MARIKAALEALQPIAFLNVAGGEALVRRQARPFEVGKFRLAARAAPYRSTPIRRARCTDRLWPPASCVLRNLLVGRHARQIDAAALDIEFPAVIDAAQAAFLIASEEQGGGAVRAALVEQSDAALRCRGTARDFAHQPHPHRRAVGLGDLVARMPPESSSGASIRPSACPARRGSVVRCLRARA